MFANYHTHTTRCGHAAGTEREYVEHAMESGLKILGFSDHTPFPDGPMVGMRLEELADYVCTLTALREEYQQKLEIHIGLELEYDPKRFPKLLEILKQHHIEYLILGQHIVFGVPGDPGMHIPTCDEKLLDWHCGLCREAIDTGSITYIAHPDGFNFVGNETVYREKIRQLCRHAKDKQIPLEINLLGLRTNRYYPNPRFWRVVGEEGCNVVFGTDAHEPEAFQNTTAIQAAMEMVQKYNLQLVDTVTLLPLK